MTAQQNYLLCLLFLFSRTFAQADPQTVIISGGGDYLDDHQRYYNVSKLAYETEEKMGVTPYVVANTGSWDFPKKEKSFSATHKKNVELAIKAAAAKLAPGESLTLFVNDHGSAPNNLSDPLSSGIVLYGHPLADELTNQELMELIKKYVPTTSNVKLVGIQCFAGGLHSISFDLPNVCSAAGTDFRSANFSIEHPFNDFNPVRNVPVDEMSPYGKGFWSTVKSKTSLFEAHMAGEAADHLNSGRGDLSSMAYVDSVMKTGAYDGINKVWTTQTALTGPFGGHIKGVSVGTEGEAPSYLCDVNKSGLDIKQVNNLISSLNQILPQDEKTSVSATLPEEYKKMFQPLCDEWSKRKTEYYNNMNALNAETIALQSSWNKLSSAKKILNASAFYKKEEILQNKVNEKLQSLQKYYLASEKMKKINKFLGQAKPEQKEKFFNLMKCEMAPL